MMDWFLDNNNNQIEIKIEDDQSQKFVIPSNRLFPSKRKISEKQHVFIEENTNTDKSNDTRND